MIAGGAPPQVERRGRVVDGDDERDGAEVLVQVHVLGLGRHLHDHRRPDHRVCELRVLHGP